MLSLPIYILIYLYVHNLNLKQQKTKASASNLPQADHPVKTYAMGARMCADFV